MLQARSVRDLVIVLPLPAGNRLFSLRTDMHTVQRIRAHLRAVTRDAFKKHKGIQIAV